MAYYISKRIINYFLIKKEKKIKKLNIGILGLSFKENCPDIRNSQVFKIIDYFKKTDTNLQLLDPWVKKKDLEHKRYKKIFVTKFTKKLDCLIISVKHDLFLKLKDQYYQKLMKKNSLIFDLKNILKI